MRLYLRAVPGLSSLSGHSSTGGPGQGLQSVGPGTEPLFSSSREVNNSRSPRDKEESGQPHCCIDSRFCTQVEVCGLGILFSRTGYQLGGISPGFLAGTQAKCFVVFNAYS